MLKLPESH